VCDNHPVELPEPDGHTRRTFLKRVALGGSTLLLPGALRGLFGASAGAAVPPAPGTNSLGEVAHRAAMHLHGSFSEVTGSWAGHIAQAIANGVDIVVPTDHDWRVQLRNYGGQYHFSGWSEPTPSGKWVLVRRPGSGTLSATSGASLVAGPALADLSAGAGALRLVAGSTSTSPAKLIYEVDSTSSNADARGTVLGRSLHIWVKPNSASTARTYLGVRVGLAIDPVYGAKQITYRLRTDLVSATAPTVVGGVATVDVPVVQGQWFELVPDLLADIAQCFPDSRVSAKDNNLNAMQMVAVGTMGSPVDGLFSYLHLDNDSAYDPLSAYGSVLEPYRAANLGLLIPHGMEHSVDTHKCQIGGQPFLYAYPGRTSGGPTHTTYGDAVATDLVTAIQVHEGVASYNHPFGTLTTVPTGTKRASVLLAQMTSALATRCHGADCIEVGYNRRGMDLAGHLELFDCLNANGLFLTATGVSDDHVGKNWMAQENRFVTLPWMRALSELSLKSALRGGRAAVGLLGTFTGSLDLSINRVAYMGQAYQATLNPSDSVVLEAYGLPSGATVELFSGPIDMQGTNFQRPTKIATFSADQFATGSAAWPVVDSASRYYRFTVLDPLGTIIAFTNPVWTLPPASPAVSGAARLVRA